VLDRGTLARVVEPGRVYLGWRLLKSDPPDVAFNVYRATDGGTPIKLTVKSLTRTTDFTDTGVPLDRENVWFVKPVVSGREQDEAVRVALPANTPPQPFSAVRLKEDVTSVDRVAVADLNGDGSYDFVVKPRITPPCPAQFSRRCR
jgi:rhamnogalacturonan endolyase